jgi:hypothetical protein
MINKEVERLQKFKKVGEKLALLYTAIAMAVHCFCD